MKYVEAENAYTAAMTQDLPSFSDALYTEMLGRIKQTDLSVPTPLRGSLYYSRTEEGKQYPIQCRRKGTMEAPKEVLPEISHRVVLRQPMASAMVDHRRTRIQYFFRIDPHNQTSG